MLRIVIVALIGVVGFGAGPTASASTWLATQTVLETPDSSVPPELPTELDQDPAPAPATSVPPVPTSLPPADSSPADPGGGEGTTTDTTVVDDEVVFLPGVSPRVQSSDIPVGSIALAILVLLAVGIVSSVVVRRRPDRPATGMARRDPNAPWTPPPSDDLAAVRAPRERTVAGATTLEFLLGLGEALIDAGAASSHVESAVRTVARVMGVGDVGVVVLPTALILSIPDGENVVTDVSGAGRGQLRLDQVDDVLALVQDAERGAVDSHDGARRLAAIRSSAHPYSQRLAVFGYACSTVGLAAILRGDLGRTPACCRARSCRRAVPPCDPASRVVVPAVRAADRRDGRVHLGVRTRSNHR